MKMIAITDREFNALKQIIQERTAIHLADTKILMVKSRLQKRLRELNMRSFSQYIDLISGSEGLEESIHLIDEITTNETSFFRTTEQFDLLMKRVLPDMIRNMGAGVNRPLKVWSAGCSTGEEPYTIAMLLETVKKSHPGIDFKYFVLGTDISRRVIEKARTAIYSTYQIQHIPMEIKHQSLLKSRDSSKGLFKVAPEVREHVRFRQLNFLDADFQLRDRFDIIFFRNVQIYFQPNDRQNILRKILSYLNNGGYIIFGYAENITDLEMDLEHLDKCIFRKNQYGK